MCDALVQAQAGDRADVLARETAVRPQGWQVDGDHLGTATGLRLRSVGERDKARGACAPKRLMPVSNQGLNGTRSWPRHTVSVFV